MGSDGRLTGREERRLPIMMEVSLAPAGRTDVEKCERTFTDNISPHGLRLQSANSWRMGEQAEVTPMKGDRFFVGLKFREKHIPWSMLQRFNGLTHTQILGAMRWSNSDRRQSGATRPRVGRKRENG